MSTRGAPRDKGAPPGPGTSCGDRSVTVADYLRSHAALVAATSVGFICLFWPVLTWLVGQWSVDPEFSHGFLIPVIAGVVLWANRQRLGRVPAGRSLLGLALVVASVGVYFAGAYGSLNFPQRAGLYGAFIGSVGFVLGWGVIRAAPFPFLYLLFCLPPPAVLLRPLRLELKSMATRTSAETLLALDVPAMPRANVIDIGSRSLEVADACSGIRSLVAITALAVLIAYLLDTGVLQGALLMLTAVPITIAINTLRIVIVGTTLWWFDYDLTEGVVHEALGLGVFLVSLALLWGAARFYAWLFRRPGSGRAERREPDHAPRQTTGAEAGEARA